MMNLYIMFIQEKKYTITTEMTYSAADEPSDVDGLTDILADIIADTLRVYRSDVSLKYKNKTNSEKSEKHSLVFLLKVITKSKGVVDSLKGDSFIPEVNDKIKMSKNDAVQGVKLSYLSAIQCEGCGN